MSCHCGIILSDCQTKFMCSRCHCYYNEAGERTLLGLRCSAMLHKSSTILRVDVKDKEITEFAYHLDSSELYISYHDGSTLIVQDFSFASWQEMMAARSLMRYYHRQIAPNYSYRELVKA